MVINTMLIISAGRRIKRICSPLLPPIRFHRWRDTKAHAGQPSPQSRSQCSLPTCRDPHMGLVVLGAHALNTSEATQQVFSISAAVTHPDYQPTTHASDICLLQVSFLGAGSLSLPPCNGLTCFKDTWKQSGHIPLPSTPPTLSPSAPRHLPR